jgi:hypothetical protein
MGTKKIKSNISVVVSEDDKFTLIKFLCFEDVMLQGPCGPTVIYACKNIPEDMLLQELDPHWNQEDVQKEFSKFIKFLWADAKLEGIIDFLESTGFIEWEEPSEEEADRFYKNMRRREARKKARVKAKKERR